MPLNNTPPPEIAEALNYLMDNPFFILLSGLFFSSIFLLFIGGYFYLAISALTHLFGAHKRLIQKIKGRKS